MKSNKIGVSCGGWLSSGYFDIIVQENKSKLYIEVSYLEDGIIHDKNITIDNIKRENIYSSVKKYLKKILMQNDIEEDILINISKHIDKNLYIDCPDILSYKIGEINFNDITLRFLQN